MQLRQNNPEFLPRDSFSTVSHFRSHINLWTSPRRSFRIQGDKCKYGRVACHSHMPVQWHSASSKNHTPLPPGYRVSPTARVCVYVIQSTHFAAPLTPLPSQMIVKKMRSRVRGYWGVCACEWRRGSRGQQSGTCSNCALPLPPPMTYDSWHSWHRAVCVFVLPHLLSRKAKGRVPL